MHWELVMDAQQGAAADRQTATRFGFLRAARCAAAELRRWFVIAHIIYAWLRI